MSISQDANKRVEKLFSDIKNIVDQPVADSAGALDVSASLSEARLQTHSA